VLKAACEAKGIKPPSESTVGRIIGDLKKQGRLPRGGKLTINGRTGRLHEKASRKAIKKTRRKGFQPRLPGELVEIDTVDIFVDGLKRYLITAIDLSTRLGITPKKPTGGLAKYPRYAIIWINSSLTPKSPICIGLLQSFDTRHKRC
jgi:hypothetical protein